jgi:UTP:GlnB (protein PII) uridylyltransferase
VRSDLAPYYQGELRAQAIANLKARHAFAILFERTRLLDALHRFAFRTALAEFPLLLRLKSLETEQELAHRRAQLPLREERLARLEAELAAMEREDGVDPSQRDYYRRIVAEGRGELEASRRSLAELEAAQAALAAYRPSGGAEQRRLVMFARGGYGRAEMSFASDVDTGYCLDTRELAPGVVSAYRELCVRMERLLKDAGLKTAHQYFEIDEQLSRFTEPETLHTIPSVLESRAQAGNAGLLDELKERFWEVLPFETLVRGKTEEFEEQAEPGLTTMDLKEDWGGLRSLQVPLWLLGITQRAPGFMTADLLRLAVDKGMLSRWEASRLLLALELLYELRNFVGAAERFYYDREARESGFHVSAFPPNRLDDPLARLYLFRKQRFASMDELDAYRLQLRQEVQTLSRLLMARVLDRTIEHGLGPFRAQVHLGSKRIIALAPTARGASLELASLLPDGRAVLVLFTYIARTGYDLSVALKDALSGLVTTYAPPIDAEARAGLTEQFSALISAPFAHRALRTLFEINDPLAPGLPSLMGRFLPVLERMRFVIRRFDGHAMPLHEHVLRSLAGGEEALHGLRREHPELHALLHPHDLRALKWALLLHGIGRLEGVTENPAQTAEAAAEVLLGLGYQDAELERTVRLLVGHHGALAALSRTATYMDQALAQYFEIAERTVANVTLLYLASLAVLRAKGAGGEADAASLRRLFDEATQMLGEMRGFPIQERSLELINLYFDRKKRDLLAETRLHLLYEQCVAQGVSAAVLEPLRVLAGEGWERIAPLAAELETLQREIVLGGLEREEQARRETKLIQALRHHLRPDTIRSLVAEQEGLLSWFFSSYPNRYLLSSLPGDLASQLPKFKDFRAAQVIADVVSGSERRPEGLLVYTRGLARPHSRVAYALSRHRLNIVSGKVNRVEIGSGEHGYCYYFQISRLDPGAVLAPRDLELMIASETPPELVRPPRSGAIERTRVRVDFAGNDGKGYRVEAADGHFARVAAEFHHLRFVLRDEPFLFYKVSRAFDLYDVEIQQSLITTTGNQVVDYFYLTPEDYARLQASTFEETFVGLMDSDLMAVVR